MFAIDTNLLVYAHNIDSKFHKPAAAFLTREVNNSSRNQSICLPTQVLTEFLHVITSQRLEKPLTIAEALQVVKDYQEAEVPIIHQKETQFQTFLELIEGSTTRKKIFDVVLAATLRTNDVEGLYTVNIDDFKAFDFLKVVNPLLPPDEQSGPSSVES